MAELRRQGLGFAEVGARQGFSERTARRFVGQVEPRLSLPRTHSEPDGDPSELRERFAREFVEVLYKDERLNTLTLTWRVTGPGASEAVYGGPPSILFLNEAAGLIRERLDDMDPLALGLLARDRRLRHRLLREIVGSLYTDYVHWQQFAQAFGDPGGDWRPPRERQELEFDEEEM
jgi:hypothetical protein